MWVLARRKENGVVGSSAKNGKKECEVRQVLLIKAGQKRRRKMDGAADVLASAIDFLKKQRQGWRLGDASKGWGWKHQGLFEGFCDVVKLAIIQKII